MKFIKSILAFFLIICAVLIFLEVIPVAPKYEKKNPWIIKEGERPLVIPHASSLKLYPPNTVYAFEQLINDGYDIIEIDLCLTKDDELVSHHDVDLVRTTGMDKLVRELDYEDLLNYNFAKNFDSPLADVPDDQALSQGLVPANLEDLFKTYHNQRFILEIKDTEENSGKGVSIAAVTKLLSLIKTYEMEENVIVSSTDDKITQRIQEESNGDVMTSTATGETFNFVVLSTLRMDFFYRPKDGALLLPIKDDLSDSQRELVEKVPGFIRNQLTTYDEVSDIYYTDLVKKNIIDDAHRHNMAVQFWTVNKKEDMIKLIELGVDGIITDDPELLKEVFDELGI